MLFTTVEFAAFFLLVLVLNWTLAERKTAYKWFLLAANGVFYASLNPRYLPLLPAVGLSCWLGGRQLGRSVSPVQRQWILAGVVTLNLGLLAFFKYFEFFFDLIESLILAVGLESTGLPAEIPFPVGLSFFAFMGLSYLIDVYRDPAQEVRSPLDVMLFVSFFPTVLSGPIMRAQDFIPQLDRRKPEPEAFQAGFALILSGLFKKIVVASYLSEHIVRQVFQVPQEYSALAVLAGIHAYCIQIYCDFSGYSDLAIGLALLMGFTVAENFRRPYTVTNLVDFWRGWHISLSTWLRDYLYISLGGNRRGRGWKYVNLMITMVLGGLWHGAHLRFLLWGFLHGLGLVVTHAVRDIRAAARSKGPRFKRERPKNPWADRFWNGLRWLAVFHFVSFLWVFFRAENAGRAWEIFRAALDFGRAGEGFPFLVIPALLAGLGMQLVGGRLHDGFVRLQGRLPVWAQSVTVALITILILKLGPDGVLPFIYFQF